MGTLTPGKTYVYERDGSKVYAREFGSSERKLIGYARENPAELFARHFTEWNDLLLTAEQNETLRGKLEEVIQVYKLIKNYE